MGWNKLWFLTSGTSQWHFGPSSNFTGESFSIRRVHGLSLKAGHGIRRTGVRQAQYWGLVERYCQNERNAKGCLINHHILLQITKIWRQDATLLPIILYTDGTWLSKNGAHNAKPLSMTIGNFPRHVMNKNTAKKVSWTAKLDKNLKFFVVFCCHLRSVLHAQSQCAKKAKEVQSFQGIQARSISWHFVRCFAACKTRTKSRWFLCNPQWHVSSNVFTSFLIFNFFWRPCGSVQNFSCRSSVLWSTTTLKDSCWRWTTTTHVRKDHVVRVGEKSCDFIGKLRESAVKCSFSYKGGTTCAERSRCSWWYIAEDSAQRIERYWKSSARTCEKKRKN